MPGRLLTRRSLPSSVTIARVPWASGSSGDGAGVAPGSVEPPGSAEAGGCPADDGAGLDGLDASPGIQPRLAATPTPTARIATTATRTATVRHGERRFAPRLEAAGGLGGRGASATVARTAASRPSGTGGIAPPGPPAD